MVRNICNRLHKLGTSVSGAKIVLCVIIFTAYRVYIPLVIGHDYARWHSQSATLTAGPMPEASEINLGPVGQWPETVNM